MRHIIYVVGEDGTHLYLLADQIIGIKREPDDDLTRVFLAADREVHIDCDCDELARSWVEALYGEAKAEHWENVAAGYGKNR